MNAFRTVSRRIIGRQASRFERRAGAFCRQYASSTKQEARKELSRTRNIGIIAHIDAGKTTTTERMLYYSGYTRRIGNVDEGSTVTDFLPAERARGITIQSAAISFQWPPGDRQSQSDAELSPGVARSSIPHDINLIDTPGHADFTFEVLRSLRVLDGAVCILDGVAGVEAQTEKVWTQAEHYRIPRIIFVNKLDRTGASFEKTVKEVASKLNVWPAVCQIPWWGDGERGLQGVGDVVRMQGMLYEQGSDGRNVKVVSLDELKTTAPMLHGDLHKARLALVEVLSAHDDEIVEQYLECDEDASAISSHEILQSLRRCLLQTSSQETKLPQRVAPVFAGASFRNVGVQPLLDGVVDLLPSPEERPDSEITLAGRSSALGRLLRGEMSLTEPAAAKLTKKGPRKSTALVSNLTCCALAFKVVTDAKRGVLVYVRVYSGSLARGAPLYNTSLSIVEKVPRLLKMYAKDAVELDSIEAGQVGVIVGLKFTRTGDTLVTYTGVNNKTGPPAPLDSLQLRPIAVPPPVFFTSVEPHSLSEEKNLGEQLALLLREDPSLNVNLDPESGQTHLAGMGELHLEIASNRLIEDLKVKASTGKIEIGYREAVPNLDSSSIETLEREIAGKPAKAVCAIHVRHMEDYTAPRAAEADQTVINLESNRLIIDHSAFDSSDDDATEGAPSLPAHLSKQSIDSALQNGITAALSRGPNLFFPLHSLEITITLGPSHFFKETTPAALSTVARSALQTVLRSAKAKGQDSVLMEPVMHVTISVNESDLGGVVHDLNAARGGHVLSLDGDHDEDNSTPSTTEDLPRIDLAQVYAPPDPFGSAGAAEVGLQDRQRQIVARVPLKEMVGYLNRLRALTGGRGTFVMSVDRFERMGTQRQKIVLAELRGGY